MHPLTAYDAALSVHQHAAVARTHGRPVARRRRPRVAARAAALARVLPRLARPRADAQASAGSPQRPTVDARSAADGCLGIA